MGLFEDDGLALLEAAGVRAYYFGSGRNGAKRYRRQDVDDYLRHIDKA